MQIIPVLDVRAGVVVHAVRGRRADYAPLMSCLTRSTRPADVGRAVRHHFGFDHFYLADLDAIAGGPPDVRTYAAIRDLGVSLWVDAGLRSEADAERLASTGIQGIVVGLETVHGPAVVAGLCRTLGPRVIFSLDLRGGMPLGDVGPWGTRDPGEIAARAVACGVCKLIVLDLARVGTGEATGTEALCRRIAGAFPGVDVIAGGGLAGPAHLARLAAVGVRSALVCSALHDGRLRPENVHRPQSGKDTRSPVNSMARRQAGQGAT